MELKLYDTMTKEKRAFSPLDPNNVRMYVCGPTVYDDAHIGNARPVIVFDVLFRLLRHVYGEDHVTYVRNITDVDDKINARAAERGISIRELTEQTNARFQADTAALGCLAPTAQPRATDHIGAMRKMIEKLVERGHAYVAEDHVLFAVASMQNYGRLARRSLDEMMAGARVEVAPYKRDAMDFVLWKPSKEGEPGWESPCGIAAPGRPGWHIECSAMSMVELLEPAGGGLSCDDPLKNTFDIHGGGIDLVFPHHENEIAQSCCAFGTERMAQVWMHNGFLQVEGEKMSKSLGNFVTIRELLHTEKFGNKSWAGSVARLAMLKTHYRQPIDWTVKRLWDAEDQMVQWAFSIDDILEPLNNPALLQRSGAPHPAVVAALCDDLNTHLAITALLKLGQEVRDRPEELPIFLASLDILGLRPERPANLHSDSEARYELHAEVEVLLATRTAARARKDFKESDRIRDELAAMGVVLKDGKDESGNPVTTWEIAR